jgi:hypothetical protein
MDERRGVYTYPITTTLIVSSVWSVLLAIIASYPDSAANICFGIMAWIIVLLLIWLISLVGMCVTKPAQP